MKLIKLTQGKTALVDDKDFLYLKQWDWYYNSGYACRKENGKHLPMHRVVMKTPKDKMTDHINGDKLDNRRSNLRVCDHSTNAMNMRKHKGKSIYKGVSKNEGLWRTVIWKKKTKAFDAHTKNERWAGMIYDLNAPALFGEFARLNFPEAINSEVFI